jgi:hypothetical protein
MPIRRKGYGVRKTLDNIKGGKAVREGLVATALNLIRYLRSQWLKGFGGTGETLQSPPINARYKKLKRDGSPIGSRAKRKAAPTGRDKIDMLSPYAADHMTVYLGITGSGRTDGKDYVKVGFSTATAREKARHNYRRRPQFFEISDAVGKRASDQFRKNSGLTK